MVKDGNKPWKLKRGLNRIAANRQATRPWKPTMQVEDSGNLDHLGTTEPEPSRPAPVEGFTRKILGWPETHKPARYREPENWEFERPE